MHNMIGAHIASDLQTLHLEAERIDSYGGKIVQIFVDPFVDFDSYKLFIQTIRDLNMRIVIHSAYSLNIARELDEYSWWMRYFLQEVMVADRMGAICIVVHLGKRLKLSEEEADQNMIENLLSIHRKTSDTKIPIWIETSSGQGSEMHYRLEDFGKFMRRLHSHGPSVQKRFGVCVDTCHVFAAGYDVRDSRSFIDTLKRYVGMDLIRLIHLNDCKVDLGNRKDRHESIGQGKIGEIPLYRIAMYFNKHNVPIILETPFNSHKKELKRLHLIDKQQIDSQ